MEQTYVAIVGVRRFFNDEHDQDEVVYAGSSEEKAREAIMRCKSEEYSRYARIEVWVDGKEARFVEVIIRQK